MGIIIRRIFYIAIFFLLSGVFFVQKADAALSNVSDTIGTSRPSAGAVLTSDQYTLNAQQVQISDTNSTLFLASDSAVIMPDPATTETQSIVNVASMSAGSVPTSGNRELYFAGPCAGSGCIATRHHSGDAIIVPISSTHTIRFTVGTLVPASGKIVITFPGTANNTASPSATGFSFNNLQPANVTFSVGSCGTAQIAVSSPTITCTPNAQINSSTAITVTLNLINPTKSAATGTSDSWKVLIQTQDSVTGNPVLESAFAKIATIESVQVQAIVEPTITFTISGLTDGSNITGISGSCGSITTNSGINPTANFVNLGLLATGRLNKAAQQLQVSTNGSSGYAITATSSGRFINPSTGVFLNGANQTGSTDWLTANDTPVPNIITVVTPTAPAFGIHACGARSNINTDQWVIAGLAADTSNSTAKFSNPWNSGGTSYYATIASYTGGPVNQENTAVLYAATITGTTPAGLYLNYFTYVATATF